MCFAPGVSTRVSVLAAILLTAGSAAAATVCYVDSRATGANNGTSWADAYTDLQVALSTSGAQPAQEAPDEFWIAAGTYRPDQSSRFQTFRVVLDWHLYGGFAGHEASRDERNPATNPTILSGDLLGNDLPDNPETWADNSYQVVTIVLRGLIDGFVIQGGNGEEPNHRGGGLGGETSGYEPSVIDAVNCVFQNNRAGGGGAAYSCRLVGCTLRNNTATWGGAVAYCALESCRLEDNTAHQTGGAAYGAVLKDCTLKGNTAGQTGGAAWDSTLEGCVLTGNTATNGGACDGCEVINSRLVGNTAADAGGAGLGGQYTNCVFIGNSATRGGAVAGLANLSHCTVFGNRAKEAGAVYHSNSLSKPQTAVARGIYNSILWGNGPGPISTPKSQDGPPLSLAYSRVDSLGQQMDPARLRYGPGNTGAYPKFVDLVGPDGRGCSGDEDLRLQPGSACIDKGLDHPPIGAAAIDLDGRPRSIDGDGDEDIRTDMGAYEWAPEDYPTAGLTAAPPEFWLQEDGSPPAPDLLTLGGSAAADARAVLFSDSPWLTVERLAGEEATYRLQVWPELVPEESFEARLLLQLDGIAHRAVVAAIRLHRPGWSEVSTTAGLESLDWMTEPGRHILVLDGLYLAEVSPPKPMVVKSLHGSESTHITRASLMAESRLEGFTLNGTMDCGANCLVSDCSAGHVYVTSINGATASLVGCRFEKIFVAGHAVIDQCIIRGRGRYTPGVLAGVEVYSGAELTMTRSMVLDSYSGVSAQGRVELEDCTIAWSATTGVHLRPGAEGSVLRRCQISDGNISSLQNAVALRIEGVDAEIADCTIQRNAGPGVVLSGSDSEPPSQRLVGCVIAENGGPSWKFPAVQLAGVGVSSSGGRPELVDCVIRGNRAPSGGGVRAGGDMLLTRCTIQENHALTNGGGVFLQKGSALLTRCMIAGNTAAAGGGLHVSPGANCQMLDCLLSGNVATTLGGGAVVPTGGRLTMDNCTVTDNAAGKLGGGMYFSGAAGLLRNCISWGNTAGQAGSELATGAGGMNLRVRTTCLAGGPAAVWAYSPAALPLFEDVIQADPLFSNPLGPDGDPATWADNDYRPAAGSPAIDRGLPRSEPDALDLDGRPRTQGAGVDLGAYESPG